MAWPEPFGALLLLAAIVTMSFVGLLVMLAGWKRKKRLWPGLAIVAGPWLGLGILAVVSPGIDEWNPVIRSDSAAWGTWEGEGYSIVLKSDSTYAGNFKGEIIRGNWHRMDFNLHLDDGTTAGRSMRFVENSGELLLLPEPPRDDSPQTGPIMRKGSRL